MAVDRENGPRRFLQRSNLQSTIDNIVSHKHGNIYAEEYQIQLANSILESGTLADQLDSVSLHNTNYRTETKFQQSMHQVARLIKTRDLRKAERDIFFVTMSGFDMHKDMTERLAVAFTDINTALEDFVGEMKDQSVFDDVTLVTASDFGRSLTGNGLGTDHAWAGQHFILGGSVRGQQVFNHYPQSLEDIPDNPANVNKGRMIPKYPWENIMQPIAEWMGAQSHDLLQIFPNRENFVNIKSSTGDNEILLLPKDMVFKP